MKWINVNDQLPPEQSSENDSNDYYFVWILGYGPDLAMYMDSAWHTSYTSEITKQVTHWCEIDKPNFE